MCLHLAFLVFAMLVILSKHYVCCTEQWIFGWGVHKQYYTTPGCDNLILYRNLVCFYVAPFFSPRIRSYFLQWHPLHYTSFVVTLLHICASPGSHQQIFRNFDLHVVSRLNISKRGDRKYEHNISYWDAKSKFLYISISRGQVKFPWCQLNRKNIDIYTLYWA